MRRYADGRACTDMVHAETRGKEMADHKNFTIATENGLTQITIAPNVAKYIALNPQRSKQS